MNTKKKAIILSVLLIGLGGFYIYKNRDMKSTVVDEVVPEGGLETTKVLSKGSTGAEVVALQNALKGGLVADGNFGALTEKRLKAITGQTSISLRDYNLFMVKKAKK